MKSISIYRYDKIIENVFKSIGSDRQTSRENKDAVKDFADFSVHAQKPPQLIWLMYRHKPFMPPVFDGWFLTKSERHHNLIN